MGRVYIRGIFRTGNALALDLLVMRESEYANRALEGIIYICTYTRQRCE